MCDAFYQKRFEMNIIRTHMKMGKREINTNQSSGLFVFVKILKFVSGHI